jgi:hypothetical protein
MSTKLVLFLLGCACFVPLALRHRVTHTVDQIYRDAQRRPAGWLTKGLAVIGILLMLLSFAMPASALPQRGNVPYRPRIVVPIVPITQAMYDRYGRTPQEIVRKFPIVIVQNLEQPGAIAHLRTLPPAVLAELIRLVPAVSTLVSGRTCEVGAPPLKGSLQAWRIARNRGPPTTGVFNTLEEIFLDYSTTGLSLENAAFETALYAEGMVSAVAIGAYYEIGPGLYQVIDEFDPALGVAIGQNIDWVVSTAGGNATEASIMFTTWLQNAPPDVISGAGPDWSSGADLVTGNADDVDEDDGYGDDDQSYRAAFCMTPPAPAPAPRVRPWNSTR